MKKYMILFIFIVLSSSAFSQPLMLRAGFETTYDTTGQFALTTLVGSKGYLKWIGHVDMKEGLNIADSLDLWISLSDSIQVAVFIRPWSLYKAFGQSDTTGRVTPAGLHLWHIQNGAGHVTIPWFRIRGTITDLTKGASRYDVYVWINKVAGLTTYGTASAGKAAGKMRIIAQRYF